MALQIPSGMIPLTAGWRKNHPADTTPMGVNNDLFGGIKVVRTRSEMLSIHPNYLQADYSSCLVIRDGSPPKPVLYTLEVAPSLPNGTTMAEWRKFEAGGIVPGGLVFKGLYTSTDPVLSDTDLNAVAGHFYVVDSVVPILVDRADMFDGVSKQLLNNDWVLYDGDVWIHLDRSDEFVVTWQSMTGKPQVILDLENNILPPHTHPETDILFNSIPMDFTWNFEGLKTYQLPLDYQILRLNWVIMYGKHLPKDNLAYWLNTDTNILHLGESVNPSNYTKLYINCKILQLFP
jgi:hypothetical protein